ncbi:fungal-specific transcription factor domain-containing protein [Colletotrichum acutatum]|uniref:Fungal-specific transcription factor domain-containing protein n=1 Tax=Glomerella acutata TaxID=27357 RepID=A0AAD8XJV9_GLOAC|nr:fungal-specific transcription factor domain-containing protein [Colletotrichum acutatum]KAK1727920.1 fungal-specific transcription factor domain-containing protein [Colletotrichum acutatum]
MASDDSSSPTVNTDFQTSPDTTIVTPPDVLQLGVEESLSPTSALENSYSTSIDSAFAFSEDLDDTGSYDIGYEDSQRFEDGFKFMEDPGCQKAVEVHLPLSLATIEQSYQQPADDSFFSASFDVSWNEPSWSTTPPPLLDLLPPTGRTIPDFPENTGLLDHYSKAMLPTMGFVDGAANPFRQHILPLSHRSSAVRSAIYALASAHREYAGLETTEGSACFHERAVAGLSAIIEDGDGFEEALATIILLIQYDLVRDFMFTAQTSSIDLLATQVLQRSSDKVVYNHLQGARHIMCAMPLPKPASVVFFEQVFRYFDVLNALTNGTSPVFAAPSSRACSPSTLPPAVISGGIDPVLGMADDLWPTLHRLAELMAMKRELQAATAMGQSSKFAVLRTEYQTAYKAIEKALESWSPTLPPGFSLVNRIVDGPGSASEAELTNIRWITSTALAYRQSALVFLHSNVSEYPSSHRLVQKHTQAALWHCAASVSHGGAGLSMLWPLFFSACHAICSRDRGLVRQAFTAFGGKKGVVDTEKPWAVVMDVWRRMDMRAYGKEQVGSEACPELWRQVAASMKFGLVFG